MKVFPCILQYPTDSSFPMFVGFIQGMPLKNNFTFASVIYSMHIICQNHFYVTCSNWGFLGMGHVILISKSKCDTGLALNIHSGDSRSDLWLTKSGFLSFLCGAFYSFTEAEALQWFIFLWKSQFKLYVCKTKASLPSLTWVFKSQPLDYCDL